MTQSTVQLLVSDKLMGGWMDYDLQNHRSVKNHAPFIAHKHQDVEVYKMKTTLCPVNKNNSGQDGK